MDGALLRHPVCLVLAGWQAGMQEGAVDWDEDWDEFIDDGTEMPPKKKHRLRALACF